MEKIIKETETRIEELQTIQEIAREPDMELYLLIKLIDTKIDFLEKVQIVNRQAEKEFKHSELSRISKITQLKNQFKKK